MQSCVGSAHVEKRSCSSAGTKSALRQCASGAQGGKIETSTAGGQLGS
jgi:hypothetical protein